MAALLRLPALLLCLSIAALLISPSHSQTCSSINFHSNNKTYAHCIQLPTLNAVLHWDYKSTNGFTGASLSIAFLAHPASPSGWIAWGINTDKPQMVGTQALLAYGEETGSIGVKPFDIRSKRPEFPSEISFVVPYMSAAYDGEVMGIFATLELPKELTKVYHVWNVGGGMSDGAPVMHAAEKENLNSVGSLDLVDCGGTPVGGGGGTPPVGGGGATPVGGEGGTPVSGGGETPVSGTGNGTGTTGGAAGPTTATTTGSTGGGGRGHSGGDRVGRCGFGLFGSVLVMAASIMFW